MQHIAIMAGQYDPGSCVSLCWVRQALMVPWSSIWVMPVIDIRQTHLTNVVGDIQ